MSEHEHMHGGCCGSTGGEHSGCCGGSEEGHGGCCGSSVSQGCGPCSACDNGLPPSDKNPLEVYISTEEEAFLGKLAQCPFLPVAQYLLTSSQSEHLTNLALSPVFLETGKETLDEIKGVGEIMLDLEERSIISLDFDAPLEGTDESLFYESFSFGLLKETVEEGRAREDFLFDAPTIVFGSVCLTALGDVIVDHLEFM